MILCPYSAALIYKECIYRERSVEDQGPVTRSSLDITHNPLCHLEPPYAFCEQNSGEEKRGDTTAIRYSTEQ